MNLYSLIHSLNTYLLHFFFYFYLNKLQTFYSNLNQFFESKEFTLSYYENATNYKINLTPKNKRMSKYMSVIQLVFSKKDGTLKELTIKENETDKLVYTFSNIQLNKAILDIKFSTL